MKSKKRGIELGNGNMVNRIVNEFAELNPNKMDNRIGCKIITKPRVLSETINCNCPYCDGKIYKLKRTKVDEYFCSKCGAILAEIFRNFCSRCGEKLD